MSRSQAFNLNQYSAYQPQALPGLGCLVVGLFSWVLTAGFLPAHAAASFSGALPPLSIEASDAAVLQDGLKASSQQNYTQAEAHFKQVLELDPTHRLALFSLAEAQEKQALTLSSEFAETQQALVKRAEHTYERLYSLSQASASIAFKLGRLAHSRNDVNTARRWYKESLAINPQQALVHYNLASLLDEADHSEEAIVEYRAAIALDARLPYAHNNLGLLLEAMGESEQAEQEYRKALAIEPLYPHAHLNLGNLALSQQRWEDALTHFKTVGEQPGMQAMSWLGQAMAYYELKQFDQAAALYERFASEVPQEPIAYYRLALCYFQLNDLHQALAHAYRYLELDPNGVYGAELRLLISLAEAS